MSADNVNHNRRRVLTVAAGVVGGAGAACAAVPFVASMQPSARAEAAGAPIEVDISKLERGQRLIVEWRGKPIWIVWRTPEMLQALPTIEAKLRDPKSAEAQQPAYAQNKYRSIKPEYFIVIGICTHLGCSPTFRPEFGPPDLGAEWKGGFFCPCHGSRFDLAGRVFQGVPAPLNLVVPPHRYVSDTQILIGVDAEKA